MSASAERPGRSFVEDVRRFGLLSTETVVERYARLVDRAIHGETVPSARPPEDGRGGLGGSDGPDASGLADITAGLATAWLRLLEATASLADRAAETATTVARLELPLTEPGLVAQGTIWIHNMTTAPAPVELAVTTLAGPAGLVVPAHAVSFAPAGGDPLPTGASAEIRVCVRVPDRQSPGRYQGLIMNQAAERPLLLQLDVCEEGSSGP